MTVRKKKDKVIITDDKKTDKELVVQDKSPVLKQIAMRCIGCFVKERCPMFKKEGTCSFSLTDVKMDSASDMINTIKGILSLQVKRINQQANIEKIDGGFIDESLSKEITRFFDLVKKFKDIVDNRDELTVHAKGTGILNEIFGSFMQKKGGK